MPHSYVSSFFTLSIDIPRSYVVLWGHYDIVYSTYGLYLWFPILEDHISTFYGGDALGYSLLSSIYGLRDV